MSLHTSAVNDKQRLHKLIGQYTLLSDENKRVFIRGLQIVLDANEKGRKMDSAKLFRELGLKF